MYKKRTGSVASPTKASSNFKGQRMLSRPGRMFPGQKPRTSQANQAVAFRCTWEILNPHKERQSAKAEGQNGLCSVLCVSGKFQRLIPHGLSGHLLISFNLPVRWDGLSLPSPSRKDLLTAPRIDVHGHTALAVYRADAGWRSATDGPSRVPTRGPCRNFTQEGTK